MKDPILPYLRKRSEHRVWPWVEGDFRCTGLAQAVVIPVIAESANLFHTLADLAANPAEQLARTLVLCVVNNRTPEFAGAADRTDNERTLLALPEFAAAHPDLRLTWIDAATEGRELGPKDGVGLARKIGLDWALALLHEADAPNTGTLICLDGDTRVAPNYLEAISAYFDTPGRWGAVVDYAHPVEGPDADVRPILAYELFLRYQELAWHFAGSPYAYPAIGSTMACTGAAYAAAGGMNRRQAGEDFYFLQHLAKSGAIGRIRDTVVVPSGRASHRVPFGTGRKVGQFQQDEADAYLTYDAGTWTILKDWLALATGHLDATGEALIADAREIDPLLAEWLTAQGFATAWARIQAHSPRPEQRLRQFHGWFDAFRTLKLTHHLRDHGYPRQDLFAALGQVMDGLGIPNPAREITPENSDEQRALLQTLRAWRPELK